MSVPDASRFYEGSGTLFPLIFVRSEPNRCGNCECPILSLFVKKSDALRTVNQQAISPQRTSHFAFKRNIGPTDEYLKWCEHFVRDDLHCARKEA